MKKLSLKNLKVIKISDKEKAAITGGYGNSQKDSGCCGVTSAWPINCASQNGPAGC